MEFVLKGTKECNQERYAEIDHEAMEDGYDHKLLPRCPGDDRQCRIHRSGTACRNGGEVSKPPYQQWSTQ